MVLRTLMYESKYDPEEFKRLRKKVWMTAIKADEELWKKLKTAGDKGVKETIFHKLLDAVVRDGLFSVFTIEK